MQAGRAGAGGRERPASRSEVELADTLGCTIPWMGYCTTQISLALLQLSCDASKQAPARAPPSATASTARRTLAAGKTDQYVGADSANDPSNEQHKRLYGKTVATRATSSPFSWCARPWATPCARSRWARRPPLGGAGHHFTNRPPLADRY